MVVIFSRSIYVAMAIVYACVYVATSRQLAIYTVAVYAVASYC